jgi:pyridoxal phosphate phosphatase PHOSPHO2
MIEALRLMKSQGAELYILSDANTAYIETALKVCKMPHESFVLTMG